MKRDYQKTAKKKASIYPCPGILDGVLWDTTSLFVWRISSYLSVTTYKV